MVARDRSGKPTGLRAADELGLIDIWKQQGFWRKEFWFAYIQSVGSQGAHGPAVQDGITGIAGLASAARRLHPRVYPDAQEAELGAAQGSPRAAYERD
jgi:hypothetical protein